MATASKTCAVCELRRISKPPIVWCTECDEGLCKECQEHHSFSKASRSHSVISIDEYQKLPADVVKTTQYCSKHEKEYQMYCKKHEILCCSKCIVDGHHECRGYVKLDDVIHNVKTSNALFELEETLDEVEENLQKIRRHQQENLTIFKESRKEVEREINKTRIVINNHLDKLQEDLIKKLYVIEEQENANICQLLSSLEKKEKEVADYQKNIMNIKHNATDIQVFLIMKKIEVDVYSINQFLQSLEKCKNLKQTSLSYKINTSIKNILSDIKSFGEVQIEAKSWDIVLIRKKAKQAQIMVPTIQSRSIENIKLTLQKTFDTQKNINHGCCMLSDGRLAFTYYNNVNVFNMTGFKEFEVQIPSEAFDIVYISKDNTLAVSSGGSDKKCITIIDMGRKKIKTTISLDSSNYGIALHEHNLVYSGFGKGIQMINLYDKYITNTIPDPMQRECYTATYKNNIYHTNFKKNDVTCYNLQGKKQWRFKNESVLRNPSGIDVDSGGNVYVAGRFSHNVVVISPDGQRHREVLTASDGLKSPTALNYSRLNNQLLVANFSDSAYLFNVT